MSDFVNLEVQVCGDHSSKKAYLWNIISAKFKLTPTEFLKWRGIFLNAIPSQ